MERATFAAGCFWGIEEVFRTTEGVIETQVGYMGGSVENPTYQLVCTGETGHAEVVDLRFDPEVISYAQLLDIFWRKHNPTTLNRQGWDIGTQYRSAIFYHSEQQRTVAEQSKTEMDASDRYDDVIVTEITPSGPFWRAEEYHQHYILKNKPSSCGG
ncbi:peptide-methionine (S)-S-oxide reductase [Malonomonas rubra DSM 5091]|uniref:Peptide methionine sulfoxide reductase MsrA n=1 Tax=Malonomonas rubra DSM 5091 TaxID=1122189 RepID=A0A1M6JYP1_MALRU|nr:peptide-methionine (S)-S-oxide reductase MsrA [Malonomonas rubra]SHJ51830.1 peptide-methionine (S)-S-oxide reductase [Malonomonas rubra DSM 5091]